ncbi:MAG: AI-2E family transporter [Bacteroidales bacterium]|nr:AI-2E family transporter [Bacteroidales bacterium]
MLFQKSYSEKLARYIIVLITIAIAGAICWMIRDVLVYIILAALVALLSTPLCNLICRIKIKEWRCPQWLGSILSILTVFAIISGIIITIIPLIRSVVADISTANINNMAKAVTVPLADFNAAIARTIPQLGRNFRIESVVLEQLQEIFAPNTFSNVVGSVTSFVAKLGVSVFSVIFISFFFIKDPTIATKIVLAFVPDKYEERVHASMHKIGILVSRYFVGMTIEVLGVSLLNFIGLLVIARMGFKYSIGIAFMTGILNIIPYIGPLMGGVIGVSLSLIIKYVCASSFGLAVGFFPFVLILAGIFTFTQLVDNSVYQPLIYSNSVKVHPLEIFIVFLVAGEIAGMAGMFAAIPTYTVLREIAKEFISNVKAVRMLTGGPDDSVSGKEA